MGDVVDGHLLCTDWNPKEEVGGGGYDPENADQRCPCRCITIPRVRYDGRSHTGFVSEYLWKSISVHQIVP